MFKSLAQFLYDTAIFIIGVFGMDFAQYLFALIVNMGPERFSSIFVIIAFLVLETSQNQKRN